jgi:hypothetical protein
MGFFLSGSRPNYVGRRKQKLSPIAHDGFEELRCAAANANSDRDAVIKKMSVTMDQDARDVDVFL